MSKILNSAKLLVVALSICMLCGGIILGSIVNIDTPQNSIANNYHYKSETDKSYCISHQSQTHYVVVLISK